MIGDRRAPEAPPQDALAEFIVLTRLSQHPEWIDQYDIGSLLNVPEAHMVWRSLLRVRHQHPVANVHAFLPLWFADIQEHHPKHWLALVDLMWPDEEGARGWEEYDLAYEADPDRVIRRSEFQHSFAWWLKRLERIAQSRSLISAAQRIAEAAWREDVEGAAVEAARLRAEIQPIRVDV